MRKIVSFVIMLFVMMALLPAAEAADLGNGFRLDGYGTFGKPFLFGYERMGDFDRYSLTSERGTWFMEGEVGLTYKALPVRPFVNYEAMTGSYDKLSFGADLALFRSGGTVFGLRNAIVRTRRVGVDRQNIFYSGVFFMF